MADAGATALNAFIQDGVRLSRQDEDNMQAFIADFFAAPDDSDDEISGTMNLNNPIIIINQ